MQDTLVFTPLTLADRGKYESFRTGEDIPEICWHSFTCLMLWSAAVKTDAAETDGCMILRYSFGDGHFFSFPFGPGDRRKAAIRLRERCGRTGERLRFTSLTRRQKNMLEAMFPGEFLVEEERDYEDYIYRQEDLALLKGTKYQKKRNHVHRFEAAGDWRYEIVDAGNLGACIEIAKAWRAAKAADPGSDAASIGRETKAIDFAFSHFSELELFGGILYQRSRPVAFALGSRINGEMADVNFEKALPGAEGAYAKINQLFASVSCKGFSLVNREDDANEPNLRKAKLSYHPFKMGEKFSAFPSGVTYASSADIPAVKALWKDAFGDTDEFIDKFISCEFTGETVLVVREGGEIVSMGSMIPATVFSGGRKVPVRYVYALATAGKARRKGFAGRILDFASSHFGTPLILMPGNDGLRAFYEKRGFIPMGTEAVCEGSVSWPARHVAFANAIGDAGKDVRRGMVRFADGKERFDFSDVALSLVCG